MAPTRRDEHEEDVHPWDVALRGISELADRTEMLSNMTKANTNAVMGLSQRLVEYERSNHAALIEIRAGLELAKQLAERVVAVEGRASKTEDDIKEIREDVKEIRQDVKSLHYDHSLTRRIIAGLTGFLLMVGVSGCILAWYLVSYGR